MLTKSRDDLVSAYISSYHSIVNSVWCSHALVSGQTTLLNKFNELGEAA